MIRRDRNFADLIPILVAIGSVAFVIYLTKGMDD